MDCQLSNWEQCNATCGGGAIKTRNVTVPAKNGGNCSQKLIESCNLQTCPGKFRECVKGGIMSEDIGGFLPLPKKQLTFCHCHVLDIQI